MMTDQARLMAVCLASLQAPLSDEMRCNVLLTGCGWTVKEINQHLDAAKAEAERISKEDA